MTTLLLAALALGDGGLKASFQSPPSSTRPCVYWYFMEGNMTREGLTADLEDMKRVGLGGGIFLEVDLGIPRGPVKYMSPEWLKLVGHMGKEADRLGLSIDLGTGPGWCGTGGPWVTPDQAMQHLVGSEVQVTGPAHFVAALPRPQPRTPFFGMGSMTPDLTRQWRDFYKDEVVIAVPTPAGNARIDDIDGKSLVYRASYSSMPGTPEFLFPSTKAIPANEAFESSKAVDLTPKLSADGQLDWEVPEGKWTIFRFGRTVTGQTTRPAPSLGLGFETDKFDVEGIDAHLDHFIDAIISQTGPNRVPGHGVTSVHFDSWEMGSQNWSPKFRREFISRRGYDPLPYLPVMTGHVVNSMDVSERFLWDLRMTAQELVLEHHIGEIKARAKRYGLGLSLEPYDLNPTTDLDLGATATEPMGEFWSKGHGYDSEYSVFEAVSAGHTNGRSVIGAESFTSDDSDRWLQHPASMKAQADWALAAGINQIYFHRYQHQPVENRFPGMTMGPYGVHWERTETWWDMAPAFHEYLARCSYLLRQGLPVSDILYLVPEGAPNVFRAPSDSTIGRLPDKKAFSFDACSPKRLIEAAQVKNGQIVFPDGVSYKILVLPRVKAMTPKLMAKLEQMVNAGAAIVGGPKTGSPSLVGYPEADRVVQAASQRLFKDDASAPVQKIGKGLVIRDNFVATKSTMIDDAKWIWTDEGDARSAAPVGVRAFRVDLNIPEGKRVLTATAAFTADNVFQLTVNQFPSIGGTDFHHIIQGEVGPLLRKGLNRVSVEVTNEGSAPNPAGLIGVIEIEFTDGTRQRVVTDGSWVASGKHGVRELGNWQIGPWNLDDKAYPTPETYPSFESTAMTLWQTLHIQPDLQSLDSLRYIHRRLRDKDVYFVANRTGRDFDGDATFRVADGAPEWWDPMTGQTRRIFRFRQYKGLTTIPFHLELNQSGFLVFDHNHRALVVQKTNFPAAKPLFGIHSGWQVSFEPRFGGPKTAWFETLSDWRDNSDPNIRHYSGKATYSTKFDAGGDLKGPLELSLGDVENAAHVWLNGKDLGVAWCAPFHVQIPSGTLRAKGNRLEIQVANLWANRLIADSSLPPEKRITHTTWNPYSATDSLLPSGLLGPVVVTRRD